MYLILILIASLVVGFLGSMKKVGFWGGFFGSLVITPIGALVLVLLSSPVRPAKK